MLISMITVNIKHCIYEDALYVIFHYHTVTNKVSSNQLSCFFDCKTHYLRDIMTFFIPLLGNIFSYVLKHYFSMFQLVEKVVLPIFTKGNFDGEHFLCSSVKLVCFFTS